MECVVSVNFRVLAQHLGTPLLSGDADKIIAFANAVAMQTRDATVAVCARLAEDGPTPNLDIANAIRALTKKPKDENAPN